MATKVMQNYNKLGFLRPSRDRVQGMIAGIGGTLVVLVVLATTLLFLPTNGQINEGTKQNIGKAAFVVSVNRTQLNALVDQYLNSDPKLKHKLRLEMGKHDMMVYGTQKLLGQSVDFGIRMKPEVTKHGSITLHAESIAVGQLPLPVTFIMRALKNMANLPVWMQVDAQQKTITIDMGKTPKMQGVQFKAVKINPEKNQFVFKGGFE
ncbi:YpmS family protein [Weissella soli]|uniref:YpmS family protein n=1 Tax=Weissella soli TaxID=155866 RepID=UPI001FAA23A2|nr:YpmS family protein [Weissella soli]